MKTTTSRSRALARLKVLMTVGVTSVAPACEPGYGVVDPLPRPSCRRITPAVKAQLVPSAAPDGGTSTELPLRRVIEITLDWDDREVAFTSLGASDERITVVESAGTATGGRASVRVPNGEYDLSVATSCESGTNRGDFAIHLVVTTDAATATYVDKTTR